jgi:hypothetical protein
MRARFAVCLLAASVCALGAGPFRNLGFEEANTNSATLYWGRDALGEKFILTGSGPTADLLPGWEVLLGGERQAGVAYNNVNFGYPSLTIYDRVTLGHPLETENRFYVQLATLTPDSPAGVPVSIVQTGLVPADAKYLSWDDDTLSGPIVRPSVNGTPLGLVSMTLQPGRGHVTYDVSQYADQEVTLALTLFPWGPHPLGDNIDSIVFEAVPEPATCVLLALGAATLCGAVRHGRRRTVRRP